MSAGHDEVKSLVDQISATAAQITNKQLRPGLRAMLATLEGRTDFESKLADLRAMHMLLAKGERHLGSAIELMHKELRRAKPSVFRA